MNPNLEKIERLLDEALQRPPEQRAAFLEGVCESNEPLRREVEALLAADAAAGAFLPASPKIDPSATSLDGPGALIGRYKLLEQIGEGGFGVVYMAEQTEPVKRRVALKIIKPGMDSRQVIGRFEAERQALALMDHPNIAKIFDAGTTGPAETGSSGGESAHSSPGESQSRLTSAATIGVGRPYFVMELVKGIPITKFCEEQDLDLEARVKLFIQVCSAVQHAHQKGVIHRDLKPTNILVTLHGDQPVPKVIDFGIAKATQQPLTDKTVFTQFQQFLGTPAYMSPEQATLSALDVDTRSDIYSLGVLLYELLTGSPPFDTKELMSAGLDEMRRIIREKEPVRPSTRLSRMLVGDDVRRLKSKRQVAEPVRASSRRLLQGVKADLDLIVMKALEKDRVRRYETANGLAADLNRYLNHEPVTAVAPTLVYQLTKFYQRNRKFARLAGAFGALLLVATVFSTWQAVRADRARQEQSRLRVDAEKQRTEAETARQLADGRANQLAARAYADQLTRAAVALNRNEFQVARAELANCDKAQRGWEWRFLFRQLAQTQGIQVFDGSGRPAFTPDGKQLVTAGTGSQATSAIVWDAATGQAVRTLPGHPVRIMSLALSPDGQRLVSADFGGTIKLSNFSSGRELWSVQGHSAIIDGVVFSADGTRLASAAHDGTLKLWNAGDGQLIRQWGPFPFGVRCAALSSDGRLIAAAPFGSGMAVQDSLKVVEVWDTFTGENAFTLRGHEDRIRSVVFSPGGQRVATTSVDGTARIWSARNGNLIHTLTGGGGNLDHAEFNRDGSLLAAGGSDAIRVWTTTTGMAVLSLTIPRGVGACYWLKFGPNDRFLATFHLLGDGGSATRTVRLWDLSLLDRSQAEPESVLHHEDSVFSTAFSSDGRYLASGSRDQTINIWSAATGKLLSTLPFEHGCFAAFTPDGKRIVSGATNGTIQVRDIENQQIVRTFAGTDAGLESATLSPDGQCIATIGRDHVVRLLDVGTGQLLRKLHGLGAVTNSVSAIAFSPDNTRLAAVGSGTVACLWDVRSGALLHNLEANDALTSVTFTRDGNTVVSGSRYGILYLWDCESGDRSRELSGRHETAVRAIACRPDGRRFVSGDDFGILFVWDTLTGQPLLQLDSDQLRISDLAWSPDGDALVTAGQDGTVRYWRGTPPGEYLEQPPETFAARSSSEDDRHRRRAEALLQNGEAFLQAQEWPQAEARFREALMIVERTPQPYELLTIRAVGGLAALKLQTGEFEECLALKRRLAELNPSDTMNSMHTLYALLWMGRTNEHETLCQSLLDHTGVSERTTNPSLINPTLNPVLMAKAVALAELHSPAPGHASEPFFQLALGLARYRQHQYAEALAPLERAAAGPGYHLEANSRLIQAMALHQMGRVDEATTRFKAAEALVPPALPRGQLSKEIFDRADLVSCWLLHAEAHALIEGTPENR